MKIQRRFFPLFALGLLAFALSACTRPGLDQPRPAPPDFSIADQNAKTLAEGLYERGSKLRSFAAQGRINYYRGAQRHFFRFEFVSQNPGSMLLTAFDPAGRPAFKMLIHQNELTGVLYQSGEYVTGPATAQNLALFIPVALAPQDLLRLMTGSQVAAQNVEGREKSVSGKTVSELLLTPALAGGPDEVWRLKVAGPLEQNPFQARVESAAFGPARTPSLAIEYEKIQEAPREDLNGRPEPFPYKIAARWSKGPVEESMELSYDEVRLGADIPGRLFTIPQPAEFKRIQLTADGRAR